MSEDAGSGAAARRAADRAALEAVLNEFAAADLRFGQALAEVERAAGALRRAALAAADARRPGPERRP